MDVDLLAIYPTAVTKHSLLVGEAGLSDEDIVVQPVDGGRLARAIYLAITVGVVARGKQNAAHHIFRGHQCPGATTGVKCK